LDDDGADDVVRHGLGLEYLLWPWLNAPQSEASAHQGNVIDNHVMRH
jgi:hypothetical protein